MLNALAEPTPGAPAPVDYSTLPLPAHRRLAGWTRAVSDRFVETAFSVREPESFVASMAHYDLGRVGLTHFDSAGHGLKRVLRSGAQAHAAAEEFYIVLIQLAGESAIDQGGRAARLKLGDIAFVDTRRPYELRMDRDYRQAVLRVPRADLERRLPDAPARVAWAIDGQRMPALALVQLLALAQGSVMTQPAARADVADAALSLLCAAVREARGAPVPGAACRVATACALAQAKAAIEPLLGDAELDVASISRALGVSPSTLHALFRTEHSSPMRWVRQRRLQRSRDALMDERLASVSLTDIALDAGFSSLSFFSRSFKAQFGQTPSAARSKAHAR